MAYERLRAVILHLSKCLHKTFEMAYKELHHILMQLVEYMTMSYFIKITGACVMVSVIGVVACTIYKRKLGKYVIIVIVSSGYLFKRNVFLQI